MPDAPVPGISRLADRRILVVGAGTQRSDDPEAPMGNGQRDRAAGGSRGRERSSVPTATRLRPRRRPR